MTHLVRGQSLAAEITAHEAEANRLRSELERRPLPPQKGRCRRCGEARPPRARLCHPCQRTCEAIRAQHSNLTKTLAALRDEHALAVRDTEDLAADARALSAGKPRGWRKRERVIEIEVLERFWEGIPAVDEGDDARSGPAGSTASFDVEPLRSAAIEGVTAGRALSSVV
jgi:hypothetical protein